MAKVVMLGVIKDGKVLLDDRQRFAEGLKSLKGRVVVKAEELARRSPAWNNYYFGAMRYLSTLTGIDTDTLHEMNKEDLNARIIPLMNKATGEIGERRVAGSTAEMDEDEFAEFIERVKQVWAERGYIIPDEYWLA